MKQTYSTGAIALMLLVCANPLLAADAVEWPAYGRDPQKQLLEEELSSLIWPRETLVSYQIGSDGAEVWLDVDLPEIEDLPQKIATVHSSGKKLVIKEKPRKHLQLEYARHVIGIAFRLAGMTLATLPATSRVIISGFSRRLSPATGSISDEYLYSIDIDRTKFSGIDFNALDRVDPPRCQDSCRVI